MKTLIVSAVLASALSVPCFAAQPAKLSYRCTLPMQYLRGAPYSNGSANVEIDWVHQQISFELIEKVLPPFTPNENKLAEKGRAFKWSFDSDGFLNLSFKGGSPNLDVNYALSQLTDTDFRPRHAEGEFSVTLSESYGYDAGERAPEWIDVHKTYDLTCRMSD
jgi:hypothetical protein